MSESSGEESYFEASDGDEVFVRRFDLPAGTVVRATVHVVHGLGEHSLRYARFAQRLNQEGFAVVVHDTRGHGKTATAEGAPGLGMWDISEGGNLVERNLQDLRELISGTALQRPGVPILLFGHSFGTLITQFFMGTGLSQDLPIAGVALSGPPARVPAPMAVGFKMVVGMLGMMNSDTDVSSVPPKLTFDKYNANLVKKVPEAATTDQTQAWVWLNRNRAEVQRYVDDELCGHDMSVGFWKSAVPWITKIKEPASHAKYPPTTPLAVFTGEDDMCMYNDAGTPSFQSIQYEMRNAAQGLPSPKVYIYPKARHELLVEENYEEVQEDIIGFFRSCLQRSSKL